MIDKVQKQIDDLVKGRRLEPVSAEQFLITLVGSCLFPFAARPMIATVLGLDATGVRKVIERRRTDLPAFLKRALHL